MLKWILFIGGPILIIGFAYVIHAKSQMPVVREEPLPQTEVWGVGRMEGQTEEIYLGFLVPGKVKEIKVSEGDQVKAGDTLVVLDNKEYHDRLSLAQANKALYEAQFEILKNGAHELEENAAEALVGAKKAEIDFGRSQYDRMKKLLPSKAVSKEEAEHSYMSLMLAIKQYDSLMAEWQLLIAPPRNDKVVEAEARIGIAEAEVKVSQDILEKTILRAPIDGRILSLDVELGEYVGDEPVLVMADTSKFCIRAFVDEFDVLKIKEGMKATVKADSADEELHGKVIRLGQRMTTKEIITNHPTEVMDTKVREVWIDLIEPNENLLVVGLRVDVTIDLGVTCSEGARSVRNAPAVGSTPTGSTGGI